MPEITVAITSYNLETYLSSCIDQLMGQTFQDFQVIIYDDCSTDGTRQLLEAIRERYPEKILVLLGEKPLRTAAASRNAILDSGLVRGKYLIFLDGDDCLEPDFLEVLYCRARESGADISVCAYERFETETGHVLCREMVGFPEEVSIPVDRDILAFVNTSLWNKLIRTEVIGDIRLPNIKVGEDLCFLMVLFAGCCKIAFTDKVLFHYRVHSASLITNVQEQWVYLLAGELSALREKATAPWMRDTMEIVSFIHAGISMPLRAYDNPEIDRRKLIRWITEYISPWYLNARWLKLSSLIHHGVKGLGIWFVKLCYRFHCFGLFRWMFVVLTRTLHIDIKF